MNTADTAQNEQDLAGFDEGFTNDPHSPTETPGDGGQDEGQRQEPAQVEYVQLTKTEYEELRARTALIEDLKSTQERSFGTAFGKIGGIERTIQQLQSGNRVEIDQEDIDALREDFPPLAAALEKIRSLRGLPGSGVEPDQIEAMVNDSLAKAGQQREGRFERRELRRLARAHPDYQQIDQDSAFSEWVAKQPAEFREDLAEASSIYDSDVVIDAMTKFKQSRRAAPDNTGTDPASARRSRKEAAVTPRGSGTPAASDPNDDFDSGYLTG